MQEIELTGILTHTIALESSPGQPQYAQFSLAIEEPYKAEEVHFVPIVAFGQMAKDLADIGEKGKKLRITGKVSNVQLLLPNGKAANRLKIVGETYSVI